MFSRQEDLNDLRACRYKITEPPHYSGFVTRYVRRLLCFNSEDKLKIKGRKIANTTNK